MAPYTLMVSNSTAIETTSIPSKPFYDFGTVFGIDSLFIIIGCAVILCFCLSCILLLCIHHKKDDKKESTEIVNGVELQYKYTVKGQSFNSSEYQSALQTDRNTVSVASNTITQNRLQASPRAGNNNVSREPLQMQQTFSHSASPAMNSNHIMTNTSPRTHQSHSPRFMNPNQSHSPRSVPPHMMHHASAPHTVNPMVNHQQFHSDDQQYYPQYYTMPHKQPVIMHQAQSYPYPASAFYHNKLNQSFPKQMSNDTNDVDDDPEIKSDISSTGYEETEFALTEVTEPVPQSMNNDVVVDTLTNMVHKAKRNDDVVLDIESNAADNATSVGGSSIGFNMEPSVGTSAAPWSRQPSQNTLYSN